MRQMSFSSSIAFKPQNKKPFLAQAYNTTKNFNQKTKRKENICDRKNMVLSLSFNCQFLSAALDFCAQKGDGGKTKHMNILNIEIIQLTYLFKYKNYTLYMNCN